MAIGYNRYQFHPCPALWQGCRPTYYGPGHPHKPTAQGRFVAWGSLMVKSDYKAAEDATEPVSFPAAPSSLLKGWIMPAFSVTFLKMPSVWRQVSIGCTYGFPWTGCGSGFHLQVEEKELIGGTLTSQYLAWVQPGPDVFGAFELEYGSVCWPSEKPCLLQQHPKLGPADQTHNHPYLSSS